MNFGENSGGFIQNEPLRWRSDGDVFGVDMSYAKRILCLANSYKNNGRCIAGREVVENRFGAWIRPVSHRDGEEINQSEMSYGDGDSVGVLDYIDITFQSSQTYKRKYPYQSENHLIDNRVRWSRTRTANWATLENAVEVTVGPLWCNGESSSRGQNDRINSNLANQFQSSLMLIRPERAYIRVKNENVMGIYKRAVRSHFVYSGASYILKVTDPVALEKYKHMTEGDYILNNALFCLSLGEIFDGFAYKLLAAIFTPDMVK